MTPLDLYLHAIYGTLTKAQVDENWTAIQTLANQLRSRIPQNNFSATANPGVGDDSASGYSAGSRWLNTVSGDFFICTDPTTGAAQWQAESTISFSNVTLDAVTAAGNSTANAVDVGELRSSTWVGTVANGATGHVVERGSNANGEYVKFADGTLICTHFLNLGANVAGSGSLSDMYRTGSSSWTFPAAFTAAPRFSVTASRYEGAGSDRPVFGFYHLISASAVSSIQAAAATSTATDILCELSAIGRWF